MARRIKQRPKGKQTTEPIKDPKIIDKIMRYLLKKREVAKNKGQIARTKIYDRNWMIVMLGFNTAFRAEDLLQLQVEDVINGYIHMKEAKTGKPQHFKMNVKLHQDIKEYVQRNNLTIYDYMFTSQRSDGEIGCISRQQADRIMKDISKHCNIHTKFGMHSLRKTFGYQFYANGGDIETLRKMYNHYGTDVTAMYIMWDKNDMEKAREDTYIAASHRR